VSGRVRQKGEINGKSANLNHCLTQVIYAGISGPEEIPPTEVLCVFDADMVAKPNFLRKVNEPAR
jgi:cellulose synthase/poly-beta-1,6-N-acetylglucosamine synthase-like glycosyltransferase